VRLKIYASREDILPEDRYLVMLYPYWGLLPEPPGHKDAGRFDEYARQGSEIFTMVETLAEADAALLPFEWKPGSPAHVEIAGRLAQEAARHGKRVIIFFNNDSPEDISIDNAVILRTSFYSSTRRPCEFAVPGWTVDFMTHYLDGKLPVRQKKEKPVVGYCGYVDYDFKTTATVLMHGLRLVLGRKIKTGAFLRGTAVRLLRRDRRIGTNFICRTGFLGTGGEAVRREYVQNIVESDYALVTRGAGNFSYRLYEVMSCGRIPVFINTDCVLPYDHLIEWKNYCVWVEARELDKLEDRIVEFHERISADEFGALQIAVRQLYEEWISPVGFHRNLWRCVEAE